MAFDPRNLGVLSYAAGFSLWTYRSAIDPIAAIVTPGHFNGAVAYLRRDDVILASVTDGGRILRVVSSSTAQVVVEVMGGGGTVVSPGIPADALLDEADQPVLDEAGDYLIAA